MENDLKRMVIFLFFTLVSSQKWDLGTVLTYDMKTTVLLGENPMMNDTSAGDVGFQLTSKLKVSSIWKDPSDSDTILLSIKSISLQLWIKSRKAPKPEGFVQHSSKLADIPKNPIILLLKNGKIKQVFAVSSETVSSLNLKRGIASIFQYKPFNERTQEVDASGTCDVNYNTLKAKTVQKIKENCQRYKNQHSDSIFGVKGNSIQITLYHLSDSLLPKEIDDIEKHEMSLVARPEARTTVKTHRSFKLVPGASKERPIIASNYVEAINKLDSRYIEVSIQVKNEQPGCPESGCMSLDKLLETNRNSLDNSALGTIKSASAFLKLMPYIREANTESLIKILKSPRYHNILPQLYDLYGSASTLATHQAAMKALRQDDIGDNTERYLWALSASPYPNTDVIKDVLKRSEETIANEKISETLALTAAAMAKKSRNPTIIEKVRHSLQLGLDSCTDEPCKIKFLRAIGSLSAKSAIPTLIKYATDGGRTMAVIAWKSLSYLHKDYITDTIKNAAMKTFLQLKGHKVDSSVRTLALNIILENNPTVQELQLLLVYLTEGDTVYEVKKYLIQRLQQLSDTDSEFYSLLTKAKKKNLMKFVNYNTFGQKGLSTAFTRDFLRSSGSNGSLVTIQEISSGLLKRGIVDIVLETDKLKYTLFSLGLFVGGLGSFINSNDQEENEVNGENEVATAGMELSFQNVEIRPFVFFNGQGELMGHVWSGTASERTSAFQTTVNLHRHDEIIPLACGFVAQINVEGAMSVDLAGQVQLSLWSRNAHSLVEMQGGIAVQGRTKLLSDFVQSSAEFSLTLEPKLELASDVDFSGRVSLCMRLVQPETIIKQHIYKIERIPGSRHRLRKTRSMRLMSPAKSYLLNAKNNEMCSKIFNE